MATITSANSVFTLLLPTLFPVPQKLEGFATDDAFAADAVDITENVMGVDGKMSSGFTPFITKMTVTLQADSPSMPIFDFWLAAMKQAKEVFPADGSITLSSIGKSYTLTNGVLSNVKPIEDAKKVLQARAFIISWESINPAVL